MGRGLGGGVLQGDFAQQKAPHEAHLDAAQTQSVEKLCSQRSRVAAAVRRLAPRLPGAALFRGGGLPDTTSQIKPLSLFRVF